MKKIIAAILSTVLCLSLTACGNPSDDTPAVVENPVPFSELTWDSTVEQMQEVYGQFSSKDTLDGGKTSYRYENYEYDGKTGYALFVFNSDGSLNVMTFCCNPENKNSLDEFFQSNYDKFIEKFGEPTNAKENKILNTDFINFYDWDVETGLFSLVEESMTSSYSFTMRCVRPEA